MTDLDLTDAPAVEAALASQSISAAEPTPMTPVIARMVAEVSNDLRRLEDDLAGAIERRKAANDEIRVLRAQINDSVRVLRNLTPKPPKPRLVAAGKK